MAQILVTEFFTFLEILMSKPNWREALEEKEHREKEKQLEQQRQKEEKLRSLMGDLTVDNTQEEIVIPELGLSDQHSRNKAEEDRISKTFETRGHKVIDQPVKKTVHLQKTDPQSSIQLRELSESSKSTVLKTQWTQLTSDKDSVNLIKNVKQFKPTIDMFQTFESKRTELETLYPGKPLKTVWVAFGSNIERINQILKDGFPNNLSDIKASLFIDPVDAIPFATDKVILICRLALGKEGHDYTKDEKKYNVKCGYQLMATWYIELK